MVPTRTHFLRLKALYRANALALHLFAAYAIEGDVFKLYLIGKLKVQSAVFYGMVLFLHIGERGLTFGVEIGRASCRERV